MQISLWLDQNSIYLRSDRMLRLAPIVQWKITVRLGYIDSLAATLKSIAIILMEISKCNQNANIEIQANHCAKIVQ